MGDDVDAWLAIFTNAKVDEEVKSEVITKKRKLCTAVEDITVPQVAPLYTNDGHLTLWGVIKQNHNAERRRERRREENDNKRRIILEKDGLKRKRDAILKETEGNEFLADLFCNIPAVLDQPSDGHKAKDAVKAEESLEDPVYQASMTSYEEAEADSSKRKMEDDALSLFTDSVNLLAKTDPVEDIYTGSDELMTILGSEVEIIEGNQQGKLNPFPGAYRKGRQHNWTAEETQVFHQGLARFGTDFMLIKDMLVKDAGASNITEKDVVSKYKREARRNPSRLPRL